MKIPEGVRHFPKPTLLVAVDLHHVKGYLCKEDEAETAFLIDIPAEHYTEKKPGFPSGDGNLEHHVFGHHVVKAAAIELEKHVKDVHEIILFIPSSVKNIFQDGMPNDVKAKITHVIEGDLTRETPIELAKRLTM